MVPMGTNTDQWIADISNYVRNSFGNSGPFVTTEQVAFVRSRTPRKSPWTLPELEASLPRRLTNQSSWIVTASHNVEAAPNAIGETFGARWDTAGNPQQPGMWFQIELPQPVSVTEVQIDSAVPFSFGGRGRGGARGGGAAAAPAAGTRGGAPAAAGRGAGGGRGGPVAGPVQYRLQVSSDGSSWSASVAEGAGATPTTIIVFAPVHAKFIRITQTGAAMGKEQWAIAQVRVYEQGK
jgi:hypothetical protein